MLQYLPQIIWIVLVCISLVLHAQQHGEEVSVNAWHKLIDVILAALLLWWGGFF